MNKRFVIDFTGGDMAPEIKWTQAATARYTTETIIMPHDVAITGFVQWFRLRELWRAGAVRGGMEIVIGHTASRAEAQSLVENYLRDEVYNSDATPQNEDAAIEEFLRMRFTPLRNTPWPLPPSQYDVHVDIGNGLSESIAHRAEKMTTENDYDFDVYQVIADASGDTREHVKSMLYMHAYSNDRTAWEAITSLARKLHELTSDVKAPNHDDDLDESVSYSAAYKERDVIIRGGERALHGTLRNPTTNVWIEFEIGFDDGAMYFRTVGGDWIDPDNIAREEAEDKHIRNDDDYATKATIEVLHDRLNQQAYRVTTLSLTTIDPLVERVVEIETRLNNHVEPWYNVSADLRQRMDAVERGVRSDNIHVNELAADLRQRMDTVESWVRGGNANVDANVTAMQNTIVDLCKQISDTDAKWMERYNAQQDSIYEQADTIRQLQRRMRNAETD